MKLQTLNRTPIRRRRGLRGLGDDIIPGVDSSTWMGATNDTSSFDPTAYSGTTSDFTPPDSIDTSGFTFPATPDTSTIGDPTTYFSGPSSTDTSGATATGSTSSGGDFNWGSLFGNLSQTALAYYKAKLTAQTAAQTTAINTKPTSYTPGINTKYQTGLKLPLFTNPTTGQTNWGAVAAVGGGALLLIAILKR